MNKKNIYKILTVLFIMQWAVIQLISQYPEIVEKYYSQGIYPFISQFYRILFGWLPFSLGDLLYTVIVVLIIRDVISIIKKRKIDFKLTFFKMFGIASVLYFLFHFNWGLNYFRLPLTSTLNISKSTYDIDELFSFTNKLIPELNEVHLSLVKNDTIMYESDLSKSEVKEKIKLAYAELAKKHPMFDAHIGAIKQSLYSLPLTYMGFAGYLNPLTNEAQVNYLIPKSNYPATACHEVAHQLGIASESEANFIGYLAASHSENEFLRYSGYLMALRYCLFELYKYDSEGYELAKNSINKGILKDLQRSQDFWRSYQNKSEKYFKTFYDSYLKANKQKAGIQSYNQVVSLLINYESHNF